VSYSSPIYPVIGGEIFSWFVRLILSRSLSPLFYFIFSLPGFLFFVFSLYTHRESGKNTVALLRLSFTPRKQLSGAYFLTFSFSIYGLSCYTHTTTPFLAGEDSLGKSKYRIGSYTSTKKNDLEEKEKKSKAKKCS